MRQDPIRDFLVFSLAIAAVATSGHSYAALVTTDKQHFYFHNAIGRAVDEGAKTVAFTGTALASISRSSARLLSYSSSVGYGYDLTPYDRLGFQLGYDNYGIRQYRNPSRANDTEQIFDVSYYGYSALLVASHLSNFEHRYSFQAGIQRSVADLSIRDNDEGTLALTRPRYQWGPRVGLGYEYFVKPNAALSVNFQHVWGGDLDSIREKMQENGAVSAGYNAPNRVPGFTAVQFGIGLYF